MTGVDAWRRHQPDLPSRGEAIRRLVEQALGASKSTGRPDSKARAEAASYAEQAAGEAIDRTQRHTGQSKAVKAERKKRLTKIPRELAKRFRSTR